LVGNWIRILNEYFRFELDNKRAKISFWITDELDNFLHEVLLQLRIGFLVAASTYAPVLKETFRLISFRNRRLEKKRRIF
jgi:hypothetical protein